MLTNALLPIAFGAVGMVAAFLIYANILKTPSGEGRVKEIADEIHLGAMVFMASEYKRCLLYTSPSPRDGLLSRMPSSA